MAPNINWAPVFLFPFFYLKFLLPSLFPVEKIIVSYTTLLRKMAPNMNWYNWFVQKIDNWKLFDSYGKLKLLKGIKNKFALFSIFRIWIRVNTIQTCLKEVIYYQFGFFFLGHVNSSGKTLLVTPKWARSLISMLYNREIFVSYITLLPKWQPR